MKRIIYAAVLVISLIGAAANAQQPAIGCMDKNVRLQADEIKQHYVSQGFSVYRDAMISMNSEEPFPIVLTLAKGQLYQIIFVGISDAWRMKIELYDESDRKVEERFVMKSHQDPNYIVYTYVPEQSGNYMLTFMQKYKHASMCGGVTILKAGPNANGKAIVPYSPK